MKALEETVRMWEVQKPREKEAAEPAEKEEPVPTAMEMALREAMERSRDKADEGKPKNKRKETSNDEMERILSRTLQHKSRSGR
jgi:hypothetical protein